MNQLIQFRCRINNGLIRIPEIYLTDIPAIVEVTLSPIPEPRPAFKARTKGKPKTIDEFPALLNTQGWKFDREEANERR